MKTLPKGFTPESLKDLAGRLVSQIDAHDASTGRKFQKYQLTKDVYDDKEVMSSLDFLEDYNPYNVPLMQVRINGLVQSTCGGFTQTDPAIIVKGGPTEDERSAAEKDLQFAWEQAKFDLKNRQAGKEAALSGRGPIRVTFQEIKTGKANDNSSMAAGPLSYVGLVLDPIRADRFICYPTFSGSVPKATLVGHWFEESAGEIFEKQLSGEYLEGWNPLGSDDSGATDKNGTPTIADGAEERPVKNYDLYALVRPGGEELEEGVKQPRRWYRIILSYTSQEILDIEEYEDPWPPYFTPTYEDEIDEFWPENTPGTRLLELQAIINDQVSLGIFGGAQAAFLTVLASGFTMGAQTVKIGIGRLLGFKGDPKFYPIPNNFNPASIESIKGTVERYADGITGSSQLGQGQPLQKKATATETDAVVQGASEATESHRVQYGDEIVRMAHFSLYLLAKHFNAWRKHNKDSLKAKKASAYKNRYSLEINGKSGANTTAAIIDKLKMLTEMIEKLKMPLISSEKPVSTDALFEMIVNALDLNVSSASLQPEDIDEPEDAQQPAQPDPASLGVPPFPVSPYDPGAIPPDVLAGLVGPPQGAIPPGLLPPPMPGPALPPPGIDPLAGLV